MVGSSEPQLEYSVRTEGLSNSEYEELRDAVVPDARFTQALFGAGVHGAYYSFIFSEKVLLPIAGAIGKSILDLIVFRVKTWLKHRPEDRTIDIYGPDGTVISIVKKEGKISEEHSKR